MKIKTYYLVISAWLALAVWSAATLPVLAQSSADATADSGIAPSGNADGDAILNFHPDLFTGRFSYTVPIKVAPGRQGSEPKLALGYNSAAQNSWCGKGWSLETAYIQRDTRHGVPVAWSGSSPQTQYDDSKGFISNFGGASSPLVQVGTGIYRQHVDTAFLTYNYFSDNHWEAVDKSGTTFYFGEGHTNQMEHPNWTASVGSSTFRWALDKVVDTNGNATYLKYLTDGNVLYLTNISYNANINSPGLAAMHEVDFLLANRNDTNTSFVSGYRVQTQRLLSEIDIKANGLNVRKYTLHYQSVSAYSPHSLLTSVTEYGSDFTTALPPITFKYQDPQYQNVNQFGTATVWPGLSSQGDKTAPWNAIRASGSTYSDYVVMADIDGDGLPDRVMRKYGPSYNAYFSAQRNTGSGFVPVAGDYQWGPVTDSQGEDPSQPINAPAFSPGQEPHAGGQVNTELVDINGDGYLDRIKSSGSYPYSKWFVQTNTGLQGLSGFASPTQWAVTAEAVDSDAYRSWRTVVFQHNPNTDPNTGNVTLIDVNGDGLPDRVMSKYSSPFDRFKIQLNTGSGFMSTMIDWASLDSQSNTGRDWNEMSTQDAKGNWEVVFMDLNGDGLPDRVMRNMNQPSTNSFVVQFNNGAGFEPAEIWGGVDNNSQIGDEWNSPIGNALGGICATLIDVNGDGLPDRVFEDYVSKKTPFEQWLVQLNTGSGFGPTIAWGPLYNPNPATFTGNAISSTSLSTDGHYTSIDFFDINGDGLPDRVMLDPKSKNTDWLVQLNQGPFPDLLSEVDNGIGGSVQVSYVASTTLNNRDKDTTDPWSGARSLLPFNVWVVSKITANDGMGNANATSYAFKGGYYNAPEREFRGFSQCTVTDPLGAKTVTYFHQSGGRDNSTLGEYQDQTSESKKGIPFRIDVIGSDGKTYKTTLNKVQEATLATGWYFPYVAQTITMDYEGLSTYRAVAKQFTYDLTTENLTNTLDLGEVDSVTINGQTFHQTRTDSIYTWIKYAQIGNILNRPNDIKITSDAAGTIRLREATNSYDGHGNLLLSQAWLDTAGSGGGLITRAANTYDQYGNVKTTTDAAQVKTTLTYDSTYQQFPISAITGTSGTFTGSANFDIRSGAATNMTDVKGLVSSNTFDVFYRPTASYISTTALGSPTLWQSRTFYTLGGTGLNPSKGYLSTNVIHSQVNDAVDTVNGYETYTYADGLGRTIQLRAEAEASGQFRVANTVYDSRGKRSFDTLPYFDTGTNFNPPNGNTYLGTLTEYDPIAREFRATPAENGVFTKGKFTSSTATGGDTGSPVGAATTAFLDGSNPWATVITDSLGKTKKVYHDDYGRIIKITDIATSGNVNTTNIYDLLGNLTNVVDNAGNTNVITYDSLSRKVAIRDPDMGAWRYVYDNAGRMTQQTDARTNTIGYIYNDELGRLSSKQITNLFGTLVGTISYKYDASDDPNYTVFPGQLYKVTDLQGYQRSSYDVRGRMLQSARYLNLTKMEYVTQAAYDDADRLQQLTYPGNAAVIKYSYDTAGHISQVKSLAGTGTQEIFYTPQTYNGLDQLSGYANGSGSTSVATTYTYYPNSTRLKNFTTANNVGTQCQNLSYAYDKVSDVVSISDAAPSHTGQQSATINNIVYDDLYRVTSVTSLARGTKVYGYNAIGNLLNNQDNQVNSTANYTYGVKPHAVTSANGINYAYDSCGNMTTNGSKVLTYDEQNQLSLFTSGTSSIIFGYDDSGERLYRTDSAGSTVWIGGIYEVNNGRILCHVLAGGQLIAIFEPQCGGPWASVLGEERWYVMSSTMQAVAAWPFQHGRGPWTIFSGTWAGIVGICLIGGRKVPLKRHEIRRALRPLSLYRQAVTLVFISAMLFGSIGNVDATAYNGAPVFYYYHTDHLGSSNVLTDRTGAVVQHYEYGTFGQTTLQTSTAAFPVSNRYTGQIADDDTGLYYYGGRYYDPQLGRFIQPDPIVQDSSDSQSLNRYSYCRNNPINNTDPSGFLAFEAATGYDPDSGSLIDFGSVGQDDLSQSITVTYGGIDFSGLLAGGSINQFSGDPSGGNLASFSDSPTSNTPGETGNDSTDVDHSQSPGWEMAMYPGVVRNEILFEESLTGKIPQEQYDYYVSPKQQFDSALLGAIDGVLFLASFDDLVLDDLIFDAGLSSSKGFAAREANAAEGTVARQTTILGENMVQRTMPFAEQTGARTLGFGATREKWAAMSPAERWKLNDGMLRARINEGDAFRYIGQDPLRNPALRTQFDLTGSELLRLEGRNVPYQIVSPAEVQSIIKRP